ncbi:DUF4232 domain-containing protein [Pseudonocardia sp. HH130630-07]|uniref:DUF4232 domain-containing protein n=1 Tax=Pseudonocardia sp. HH130630-07 TaxID=1690815 RepID=UPI0008152EC0|nr:DUF4232 domain-containing protein [Pseudonocardia sp. HH130630-07]ANY05453.1 hypothetical protein AFB00_03060 [Pseudonocardia sp. HH130630-07]
MTFKSATLAAGLLATGLLLAGCGGDPGTAATGQMSAPAEQPAATAPEAAGEDAGAMEQGVQRCTDADLTASLNAPTGTGQQNSVLAWRNVSDAPCAMTGFGGVDLRGPADPTFGPSYSLPRSSAEPTTITLQPGGTGITTITTLSGGEWTPTEIVVTAPDETVSKTVPWRGGPVQRQDGATAPGSYIGPVEQGSI